MLLQELQMYKFSSVFIIIVILIKGIFFSKFAICHKCLRSYHQLFTEYGRLAIEESHETPFQVKMFYFGSN